MLSVLGRLVEIYVDKINSGEVPCLDNAVVVLANQENQAAVQEALKVYQRGMEEVRHAHSDLVHLIFILSCFQILSFTVHLCVSLYRLIIPFKYFEYVSKIRTTHFA